MKLVRKTNKAKRRLVYVIVTFLALVVFVIWGFQIKKLFIESASRAPDVNFEDIKRGMDFAKTVEDRIPGDRKSFKEIIQQAQLTAQEESMKEEAKNQIADDILQQLQNNSENEATTTPVIIENDSTEQ